MSGRLRSRLDRLERCHAAPGPDVDLLPAWFWELAAGGQASEDEAEALRRLLDEAETEHARRMEDHPAGRAYRRALTLLSLPQPETLRSIDVMEEAIRLAGERLPLLCGLRELPAN